MKSVVAIDLGATSGRAVLYGIKDGRLIGKEITRFPNSPIKERGRLCWNVDFLFSKILDSIKLAKQESQVLSVGIDTWGVDFALLDNEDKLLALPVHYRDSRTQGILEEVAAISSLSDLYLKTGNQLMELNTLFQLLVTKKEMPDTYFKAEHLLMMPDYFNFLLTGKKVAERSIASTTQMVNPLTKDWNREVLSLFDISDLLLSGIVNEGNVLGTIKPEFGFTDIAVVNVCEHDTASAIACLPSERENPLFIVAGTWSLIGMELAAPMVTTVSMDYNFTNEAGHSETTTFLKNCTGLWILEELRRDYKLRGQSFDFEAIREMVLAEKGAVPIIDTDYKELAEPGHMIEKITHALRRQGKEDLTSPAQLFKCAYHSLAHKYREVISQVEDLTQKSQHQLYLIGGGSKSAYFSQLVADVTGKTVITGLSEATAVGNALVQLVAMKELSDMEQAKRLVKDSVNFTYYYPNKGGETNETLS